MNCLEANSISTFGGNPLATAAALANLDYLLSEDLPGNALRTGRRLREHLDRPGEGLLAHRRGAGQGPDDRSRTGAARKPGAQSPGRRRRARARPSTWPPAGQGRPLRQRPPHRPAPVGDRGRRSTRDSRRSPRRCGRSRRPGRARRPEGPPAGVRLPGRLPAGAVRPSSGCSASRQPISFMPQGKPYPGIRSTNGSGSKASGPNTPAPFQMPASINSMAMTGLTAVCHTTAWTP